MKETKRRLGFKGLFKRSFYPILLLGGISAIVSTTTILIVRNSGNGETSASPDSKTLNDKAYNFYELYERWFGKEIKSATQLKQALTEFITESFTKDKKKTEEFLSEFTKIINFISNDLNTELILEVFVNYLENTPIDKRPLYSFALDKLVKKYENPVTSLNFLSPLKDFKKSFSYIERYYSSFVLINLGLQWLFLWIPVSIPFIISDLSCILNTDDSLIEKVCGLDESKEEEFIQQLDDILSNSKNLFELVKNFTKLAETYTKKKFSFDLIFKLISLIFFPRTPQKVLELDFTFFESMHNEIDSLKELIEKLEREKVKSKVISIKKSFIARIKNIEEYFVF